ncbi:nucleic-acid-binding protein from transposon X-element [Trichonephila clavipes]|nr:nucleic-acid-binding protein from transposon X-element [Trichonephila clavipes]
MTFESCCTRPTSYGDGSVPALPSPLSRIPQTEKKRLVSAGAPRSQFTLVWINSIHELAANSASRRRHERYAETRIRYQQELIDIETFDQRDTDAAQLQSYIHAKGATELDCNLKLGELKLLFPCPVKNCNHNTTNGLNATRHKKRAAESCILPASFNPYFKNTNSTSKKTKTNDKDTCNNTAEINNRKELPENTIPVNNPFSVLTIDDDDMEVAGSAENNNIAQPKVKPIMLKFNKNYNLILQHLNRKYPDSVNKLTGEYIKITAANIDQHGEITNELKEKGEEFYAVPNPGDRPLKMVLKGLPSNTDIDDIKYDLANQGLPVMKVAQLTQRKSKFPLPLFLVEVRKNVPDSRDIRDISTCCFMSITWDSFRRRPGPSQCYNCNYFHHSSLNCSIKTRCLKCGQEHRTSDCSITEKIENPKCINCNATGHMANWSPCPKFPKIKPKKGDAQNDRNKININENRPTFNSNKTTPTISYANAAKNEQQMAARKPVSEPASPTPSLTFKTLPLARISS